MEDEDQQRIIDDKIKTQINILKASETILSQVNPVYKTKDKKQVDYYRGMIEHQEIVLNYLKNEASCQSLNQPTLFDSRSKSKSDTNLARYSPFQQITDEAPMTPEKLSFLSQVVQRRRDADSQLKYGFEKYLSGDGPNAEAATEKLEEVKSKLFILNQSLHYYKNITVRDGKNVYERAKVKVTGTFEVTVLDVTGVQSRNGKRVISGRVDNNEKVELRMKTKHIFNLTNAVDFEISCSEVGCGLAAFQFFPIHHFVEDASMAREGQPTQCSRKAWVNLLPFGKIHLQLTYGYYN